MKKNLLLLCLASCVIVLAGCGDKKDDPVPDKVKVTGFTPESGLPGAAVTIQGENFGTDKDAVKVMFGTAQAAVASVTSTSISCAIPTITEGTYTITVEVGTDKVVYEAKKFTVLKENTPSKPAITGFTPESGYPGQEVTIQGEFFGSDKDAVKVLFGTAPVAVSAVTPISISCAVPVLEAGQYTITVEVDDEEVVYETKKFTVVEAPKPTVTGFSPESDIPGATVTIDGTHFGTDATAVKVLFGEEEAAVSAVTATSITCEVPDLDPGQYTITVEVGDDEVVYDTKQFTVLDPAETAITGFYPETRDETSEVIITGINIDTDAEIKVFFGETEATVTAKTETAITVTVPKMNEGDYAVKVTIDGDEYTFDGKTFEYVTFYKVVTVAGVAGADDRVDGTLATARFKNGCLGLGVVEGGHVYLCEADNVARYIDIEGDAVSTITPLGNRDGGVDSSAKFQGFASNSSFSKTYILTEWYVDMYSLDNTGTCTFEIQSTNRTGNRPWGFTFAGDDEYIYWYVTDANNGYLWKMNITEGESSATSVQVTGEVLIDDGQWTFFMTYSAKDDCFYVSSNKHEVIHKIKKDGTSTLFAGAHDSAGYNDGALADSKFYRPRQMAVDADGMLYVADFGNNVIRKIDPAAGTVSTVLGSGDNEVADGTGLNAKLSGPSGLAIDENGDFYISHYGAGVVSKMTVE